MDEATGKETAHARVFCNAKGIDELDDFFTLYPRIDAWRAGSTFDVEILSGGDWKKIYNRPY